MISLSGKRDNALINRLAMHLRLAMCMHDVEMLILEGGPEGIHLPFRRAVVTFQYGVLSQANFDVQRRRLFVPMSQQPDLISPSYSASPAPGQSPVVGQEPHPEQTQHPLPPRIPPWLVRAELYLRVLLRMYIGLAVCYIPWSNFFWDQNPLFVQFPTLGIIAANGAVRGLISGLGLLNLWIALQNALHYRGK